MQWRTLRSLWLCVAFVCYLVAISMAEVLDGADIDQQSTGTDTDGQCITVGPLPSEHPQLGTRGLHLLQRITSTARSQHVAWAEESDADSVLAGEVDGRAAVVSVLLTQIRERVRRLSAASDEAESAHLQALLDSDYDSVQAEFSSCTQEIDRLHEDLKVVNAAGHRKALEHAIDKLEDRSEQLLLALEEEGSR